MSILGVIGSVLGIGSALQGGRETRRAAERSATAIETSNRDAIDAAERAEQRFIDRTQPFADIGLEAGEQLRNFLANPNASLDQINPMASFFQEQGFEDIRGSAAGGGRNPDRDLSEFQTGLTSTLVPQFQNQRFNQLFNVFGAGQNAATGQGTAALQTGGIEGNALQNIGRGRSDAAQQRGDANLNVLSNIAGIAGAASGSGMFGGGGGSGGGGSSFNPMDPNLFRQSQNPNLLQSFGTF